MLAAQHQHVCSRCGHLRPLFPPLTADFDAVSVRGGYQASGEKAGLVEGRRKEGKERAIIVGGF